MKEKILAVYERKSTLWKNANYLYHVTNWTKMECLIVDYSEEIERAEENGLRFTDSKGNDVTEQEMEKRYGRPYEVRLTNARGFNSNSYRFATKDEANDFFKQILHHKILVNWKRVQ